MRKLKKFLKQGVSLALCAVLGAGLVPCAGLANAFDDKALNNGSAEQKVFIGDDALSFKSRKASAALHKKAEALPDKVDLRNFNGKNYVTQVKQQTPWNSCWSFAAIAAAEESLLHEYGLSNEEFKSLNDNKELDFSEKALAWFAYHKITKDDVCDSVPASQIGEGGDVDELEKNNKNAVYGLGGNIFYATSLFSAGSGPKSEYHRFEGKENEYPYAYRGKNGWTDYDLFTREDLRQTARDYYYPIYVKQVKSDKGFEDWFNSMIAHYVEKGNGDGELYSGEDDWSIPVDHEHRTDLNYAILEESATLPSPAKHNANDMSYEGFDQAGVDAIKKELSEGKAVSICYYADQSTPGTDVSKSVFINVTSGAATWAQYTYDESKLGNHAVTIVGYDDNYSKDNFLKGKSPEGEDRTPPLDGAFIVKNSWGSINDESEGKHNTGEWGIDGSGYFYLSYYDKSLEKPESFDFYTDYDEEAPGAYTYYVNQYDFMPAYGVSSLNDQRESHMANVFETGYDQKLSYISTQTASPGTEVTYEIYKLNENYENPTDGELLETDKKTFEFGGYHRIELNKAYPLAKGTHFSLVLTHKIHNDKDPANSTYETLCSEALRNQKGFDGSEYKMKGVINKGESYLFKDGSWNDWSDYVVNLDADYKAKGYEIEYDNFAIKAYSVPASKDEVAEDLENAKVTLKTSSAVYNGKAQAPVVKSVTLDGKAVPSSAYTVSVLNAKGTKAASPKNAGSYTVTVTGKTDSGYKGTAKTVYKIKQAANTIKINNKAITKKTTYKVKKKAADKKATIYKVTRNGSGKITFANKSSSKLKKYLAFKNSKVTLKKKAPKGNYKFTLTVEADTNWKKTTTKLITVNVK